MTASLGQEQKLYSLGVTKLPHSALAPAESRQNALDVRRVPKYVHLGNGVFFAAAILGLGSGD